MDAISECEQFVRIGPAGVDDPTSSKCPSASASKSTNNNDQWVLYYRKEMFTPWHDVQCDEVATDLIYRQIVSGVLSNEYRLKSVCNATRTVTT